MRSPFLEFGDEVPCSTKADGETEVRLLSLMTLDGDTLDCIPADITPSFIWSVGVNIDLTDSDSARIPCNSGEECFVSRCLSRRYSTRNASWHTGQTYCFLWDATWARSSGSETKLSLQKKHRYGFGTPRWWTLTCNCHSISERKIEVHCEHLYTLHSLLCFTAKWTWMLT